MMNRTAARRPALRALALAACVWLALSVPTLAFGLGVTQTSTQPNGASGVNTYGGIPTRLTWKAQVKQGDPAISAITLKLPEKADLSKATVHVLTLEGLTRKPVTTTPRIEGTTVIVPFDPAVVAPEGGSTNIDITIEDVQFPNGAGSYKVEATAETSGGPIPVPSDVKDISISNMTTSERTIFWLDQQPWVAKWNSVNFLSMFFKPQAIVASFGVVFQGWLLSLFLVLIGFPLAIPAGLLLAFAKMSKLAPIRWIASFYINVVRGTPLFLQIYIAFFGLPLLGINPNKYLLGVIVLALNSSAYLAEIFRAGIQSISKGQFEAASSLGMSYWQAMQYVIIPQTVKRVLPTMTSEFILLYKDTAMLSAVGVFELMMYSKNLAAISGNVTPYIVAAVFYLVVTTPLIHYVQTLEHQLAIAEGGAAQDDNNKKTKRKNWKPASAGPNADRLASSATHESR